LLDRDPDSKILEPERNPSLRKWLRPPEVSMWQDQNWMCCRILAIFSDQELDIYFWKILDQDRIRIFVWFL